ncbi:MAG: SDR family NAD(P)-dependent oxidoreductase [Rhodospirillales bacterium]|nr:SDR family NAD(P)-dependent oxidoreductase [Rhodospirillales bacterium]MBO6785212.1 SDR family NAD(P)-dependent oxidoreductase [Rhodospirillales bacterium]
MAEDRFALIVGAGQGLSASLARRARAEGMTPLLAARNTEKLADLLDVVDGHVHACDVSEPASVRGLFDWATTEFGVPELVVFNPSARVRGPIAELDPDEVRNVLAVSAFGGFLVGQAAAKAMLPRGSGSILFTGASASVKGYVHSASFAMGKFALRGLAQSMARELAPKGIHVGHFVIDGGIGESEDEDNPNKLDPDDIADTYFHIHHQPKSAWTWEVELRPFVENF